MAVRFNLPIIAFDDANGNPLSGGFVEFYVTGTATPKAIFSNDGLSVPYDLNASGQVVLDSAGRHGDLFLEIGDYKVIVKDSLGTIIKTMDPVHGTSAAVVVSNFSDVSVYVLGAPSDGEVYPIYIAARSLTLPATLTSSVFYIATHPTGTLTVTLKKNASSIGTIAFATNGTPTVTFSSNVTFAAGDRLSLTFPSPADATGAGIAFTFVFTVN